MMPDSSRFFLTPSEITQVVSDLGVTKVSESWSKLFLLGILAGAELFTGNTMMLLPLAQRKISMFGLASLPPLLHEETIGGLLPDFHFAKAIQPLSKLIGHWPPTA